MIDRFKNRTEAGTLLASKLADYAGRNDVVVLGLPRGGIPVASEVAKSLKVPLDVFTVRKLGVPGHAELAMGAIATGGIFVLNTDVVRQLRIPGKQVEAIAVAERSELERREAAYRGKRPAPDLRDKVVILVDDGIATGSTMRAAVRAARQCSPACIIVAVPTASPSAFSEIAAEADEVISLKIPEHFEAVGEWYADFSQTSDAEVKQLLGRG